MVSLLVHVGNALSPPGIHVGSLLRSINQVVDFPDVTDEQYDQISKNVLTIKQGYQSLASTNESERLLALFSTLTRNIGDRSSRLQSFAEVLKDLSFHFPSSDSFVDQLNKLYE